MIHWQVDARKLGIVITCRGHDKEQVEAPVRAFDALIEQQAAAVVVSWSDLHSLDLSA